MRLHTYCCDLLRVMNPLLVYRNVYGAFQQLWKSAAESLNQKRDDTWTTSQDMRVVSSSATNSMAAAGRTHQVDIGQEPGRDVATRFRRRVGRPGPAH